MSWCFKMFLVELFRLSFAIQLVTGFVTKGDGKTNKLDCGFLSKFFDEAELLSMVRQVLIVLPTSVRCHDQLTRRVNMIATWPCSDPINLSSRIGNSAVVFALLCNMDTNVRLVASATNRTEHQWLMMSENGINEAHSFTSVLKEFHVNSKLFIFTVNNSVNFYDTFTLDPKDGLVLQQTHEFSSRIESRRGNFGGMTLKFTAVSTPAYDFDTNIQPNSDGNLTLFPSFSVAKLDALEAVLNFTSKIKMAKNFGSYDNETRKWAGMVGDILNGKADISLTHASEVPNRQAVVDFTVATSTWKLCAYFRKPPSTVALFHPFQKSLWYALLAWIGLISLTSLIFRCILKRWGDFTSERRFADTSTKGILCSTVDSFLCATGMLCIQGFHHIPNHTCLRILDLVGHLAAFVVFVAYSGVLISFLSVAMKDPFKTIEELLTKSYSLVIDGNPLLLDLLKDSPLFHHSNVNNLLLEKKFTKLKDFREDILLGGFGYVTEDARAYYSLRKDFSEMDSALIGDVCMQYDLKGLGSMIAKKSPYKRFINYQILRFKQHGIESQWRRRYWPERLTYDSVTTFDGVDLTSVSAAFVLYFHALWISLGILLIECVIGSKRGYCKRDKCTRELRHLGFAKSFRVRTK